MGMVNGWKRRMGRAVAVGVVAAGGLWGALALAESDGPYRVIGYNFADRSIYSFVIDGFGAGNLRAHKPGGGGGAVCCMEVPRGKKTWHIKLEYELNQEQYKKNLPGDVYETDIAIPPLPDKHGGYIEFYLRPERRIEARWAAAPTDPRNPNTTSNASSTTN